MATRVVTRRTENGDVVRVHLHDKSEVRQHHNPYIKKRGDKWVIVQKGTGRVLSTHDTREKAEASFRAMEMSKHGGI